MTVLKDSSAFLSFSLFAALKALDFESIATENRLDCDFEDEDEEEEEAESLRELTVDSPLNFGDWSFITLIPAWYNSTLLKLIP